MTKINKFTLGYTRDTSWIMQESWHPCFQSASLELFGEENPIKPTVINYMSNGAIEIWESKESLHWFMNTLLKKNQEKGYFNKGIKKYLKMLNEIETYWERETVNSIKELIDFKNKMFETVKYFTVFYYSGVDDRTPKDLRKRALEIRNTDKFFDECDKVIRRTLLKLHPEIKGYETTILADELENFPSKKLMEKRKKHCVLIGQTSCEEITFKEFMKKHPEFEFEIPKITKQQFETGILKGQTANKGTAIGTARIIRIRSQIPDLKEGDILIGTMTTPDYIPAMKKAAAIVTDEGGITCHAAIVSRELNKPCIIATKVATKFFKTGDKIEVDADNGVVRKIE